MSTRFFVTGGTLQPNTASYVTRAADTDLYESLIRGDFCYVLNARQMGKSSLMASTAAKLDAEGVKTAFVDLTAVGQNATVEQWYYGIASQVADQLGVGDQLVKFWDEKRLFGPQQRWGQVLTNLLLPNVDGRFVLFVDEIDLVRSLPFRTDDFFAGIRELYNRRSTDADLNRMAICLLGVTSPAELIDDPKTTPFNVGVRIYLADFTFDEAQLLCGGLNHGRDSYGLLRRVFFWTDGHPYLTQRLCRAISEHPEVADAAGVDFLCGQLFLSQEGRERDDNLLFVRDRLRDAAFPGSLLLRSYLKILKRKRRPESVGTPSVRAALVLSGVVKQEGEYLRVRNRLYAKVFDRRWVMATMPGVELRRIRKAFWAGFGRAAALLGASSAAVLGFLIAGQARHNEALQRSAGDDLFYSTSILNADRFLRENPPEAIRANDTLADIARKTPEARNIEWSLLMSEANPPVKVEPAISAGAQLVALDSRHLLVGGKSEIMELDRATGARKTLIHTDGPILYMAAIGGAKVIASVGPRIRLWDISSGNLIRTFNVPAALAEFSVSSDGQLLAMETEDDSRPGAVELHILRLADGTQLWSGWGRYRAYAFQPGTQHLIVFDRNQLEEVVEARLTKGPTFLTAGIEAARLRFDKSGKRLAIWESYGQVEVVDTGSWKVLTRFGVSDLDRMDMNGAGTEIATSSSATGVEVRPIDGGRAVSLPIESRPSVAFADDKTLAIFGRGDYRLWSFDGTASEAPLSSADKHPVGLEQVAFVHGGRQILTESGEGTMREWDADSGRDVTAKEPSQGNSLFAESLDGRVQAVSGPDGIEVSDSSSGAKWSVATGPLWKLKVSRSGLRLIALTETDKLLFYDLPSHELLASQENVVTADISDDGLELAAIGYRPADRENAGSIHKLMIGPSLAVSKGEIAVSWNRQSGWKTLAIEPENGNFYALAFKPSSHKLVVSTYEHPEWQSTSGITTFDPDSNTVAAPQSDPPGELHRCTALAFTPDGKRVLDGASDGSLRIRDATKPNLPILLELDPLNGNGQGGHTKPEAIQDMCCSPDGASFVAAYEDGSAILWRGAKIR